jgi:MoxR-like ATPase
MTDEENEKSFQGKLVEIQLNGAVLEDYAKNLTVLSYNTDMPRIVGKALYDLNEAYYKMLLHRHTVQGQKFFKNPVITDVAMNVFENIDSQGEIKGSKDEMSAYTMRKAEILAQALKDSTVNSFISNPKSVIEFSKDLIKQLAAAFEVLGEIFEPQLEEVETLGSFYKDASVAMFDALVSSFDDLDPTTITYSPSIEVRSDMEKVAEEANDETLEKVVEMLLDKKSNFQDTVSYVLERKSQLKKFFQEENSFYTCRISEGNPFLGLAPGAIEVVPSERPKGDMKWILGSGYDDIRNFVHSIEASAKYHSLFMATSPSKTADKSNALLIGPPGCGKTEVMRSLGGDKSSIGIFAQGSDFLTCWKGEAEKNPKRLFQEAIKLNRESGKQVYILIDEVDAVMNNDREHGGTNLTLEFQILMDGLVRYPNLSIWGATNHPERIPMAMMRRFNKVAIVGELEHKDRKRLLKHFLGFMPMQLSIPEDRWDRWSSELEGATGDVIRKVADLVWRDKLHDFILKTPGIAEEMVKFLQPEDVKFSLEKLNRDEFKAKLKPHLCVESADIEKAMTESLENVFVRNEIETAVRTYEDAKELIKKIPRI